jgi:hypothetical protein
LIVTSVFSAKVKGGVIVADPRDDYAELTAEEAAELEAAIVAADRGEGVPWEMVRDELRRSHT